MRKLFVSLPMRGRTEENIINDIQDLKGLVESLMEEEFEVIDTLNHGEEPDEVVNSCWYLGQSISKLAEADFVIFAPYWKKTSGCIVEHMICALYDIPYAEVRMEDLVEYWNDFDDFDDIPKGTFDEDEDEDYVEPEENPITTIEPEKPDTETEQ